MAMEGHNLIDKLATLTGLPEEAINNELITLVESYGIRPEALTISDVRNILADYLQDVLLNAKREISENFSES